jgi:2-C-methyl-D-erythritol 2,4-cyclodiphosphate synthase
MGLPTPRIGIGVDTHRFAMGRRLVLGTVEVEHDRGLDGHSDADVLTHAIVDAILGALAAGNIGTHFPNTDPRWKGADSRSFLDAAVALAHERGYAIGNVDATIEAEEPKLMPHAERMREALAAILGAPTSAVSVKATTGEGSGPVGRGEVMRAHAVALLVPVLVPEEEA